MGRIQEIRGAEMTSNEIKLFTRWHDCPAIKCPVTGEVVVVFNANARGYQECVALIIEIKAEIERL